MDATEREIREALEKATPGPLRVGDYPWSIVDDRHRVLAHVESGYSIDSAVAYLGRPMPPELTGAARDALARLIVAAVNAVPALLAALDAERAEVERLQAIVEGLTSVRAVGAWDPVAEAEKRVLEQRARERQGGGG